MMLYVEVRGGSLSRTCRLFSLFLLTLFLLSACGGLEESPLIDGTSSDISQTPGDDLISDEPINQAPGAAATLYAEQCASCHGSSGEGGSGGALHACDTCDDEEALYQVILDTMPLGIPAQCDAQCSQMLTNYVLSGFQDDSGEDPGLPGEGAPSADLSASQNTVGTVPLTVRFSAINSADPDGQIVNYIWDFGDGTQAAGLQTEHTYSEAGNYVVSLTVTDVDGLSDTNTLLVQGFAPLVNAAPLARFSSSASFGTAPFTVNFDATESSDDVGIVLYRWDFGGVSAFGSEASHTFTEVGDIEVTLTVFDAGNLSNSTSQTLQISAPGDNSPPTADASLSANTQGEAPLTVQFNGLASSDDSGSLTYSWLFGDGNQGLGSRASHVYSSPGTYTATLIVSDGELTDRDTVTIDVAQPLNNTAPQAEVDVSVNLGLAPLSVSFDASASSDNAGIVSYLWTFGDGDSALGVSASHTYTTPGTYQGSLIVSDEQGLTSSAQFDIVVQDESDVAAGIYASQCASCHGADGEGLGTNPPLTVARDLAVLIPQVAAMPPSTGINCGAIDGCATIVAQYILDNFTRENQAPVADASNSLNTSGPLPLSVDFDAGASQDDHGIVSYQWDFGDGSSGNGQTASHIYTAAGVYQARLTVTDAEGETDVGVIEISVTQSQQNQPPIASITADATSGIAPFTLSVSASASADDNAITAYDWDFDGDGESDSGQVNAEHIFVGVGSYEVSLSVSDSQGLSDSTSVTISVFDDGFGEDRYLSQCAICHADDGQGGVGPRLTESWERDALNTEVLRMIEQQNSNCQGIDTTTCTAAITDYIMDNIAGTGGSGDSAFACEIPEPATGIDIKRLSKIEYRNTMFDIVASRLGDDEASAIIDDSGNGVDRLVAVDHHESGFRQMDTKVALEYVEGWFLFSMELADAVMPNITNFVGDDCAANAGDADCMRSFIESAGREFFRKPLTEAQIDHYATSEDYTELLVRMFNAPDFLYHMEIDGADVVDRSDLRTLTPYELAARLSYTYWQSMPDEQLRADADSGAIVTDYDAVLDRVINSPKSRSGLDSYFEDWWETEETAYPSEILTRGLRLVDQDPGDADTTLPLDFDTLAYRHDAIEEVLDLAEYVTWEQEGTLADLFTNNRSFARSADLAKAYGVEAWDGDFDNVITFPEGQRSGLLTRAAFHIQAGTRSNPILKGARIRKRLLCDSIPLPADNTPPDVEPDPNWTTRELITAQTESTAGCAACHEYSINPPGFATEDFDVLGRFRDTEVVASVGLFNDELGEVEGNVYPEIEREIAISAQVLPRVDGDDDIRESNSGVEFSELVATTPKAAQCFARTFFRHTFSREEEGDDGCVLQSIEASARDGSISDALRAVAEQPEFKLRKIAE